MTPHSRLTSNSIGEYQLQEFLGAGGMGEVWRAVHTRVGHTVAIKLFSGHDPGFAERLLNEARILARLHHPHIAAFHEFQEYAGRPGIVMEYVDGQTLSDRLRTAGALPLTEALTIFRSVVEAVAYIHCHGVIHRDLKSANIRINSAGQVKLLDFGIARAASSPHLTQTGYVIGTLESLAPEQLLGATADERTDIWALGVLLYEMLAGRVPFVAQNVGELYAQITRASAPPLANIPRAIEAIIARCLKKNPAARYASARELLVELERVQTQLSLPQPAESDHWLAMIRNLLQQHWPVMTTITAFALLVAVFALMPSPTPLPDPTPEPTPTPFYSGLLEQSSLPRRLQQVTIDVPEGNAEVIRNGMSVGMTPYTLREPAGTRVQLQLRQPGYLDTPVSFEVTEVRKHYAYTMEKERTRTTR